MPRLRGMGQGDQHVKVTVVTPTNLTEEQKELLRQFAGLSQESAYAPGGKSGNAVRTDETGVPRRVTQQRLMKPAGRRCRAHGFTRIFGRSRRTLSCGSMLREGGCSMPAMTAGRRNGKGNCRPPEKEDVRVDPKTADADDHEAAARARAADSRQRG